MNKRDEHYWWMTMFRGLVALLAGSAIMVIPGMAKTLLLLPIAIAMSILGLAVYGAFDSVLVFITSFMAASPTAKLVLRLQGVIGITVSTLLYIVFYDQVRLHWFLTLIAIQSLAAAVAEVIVARHSMTHATSMWNFASSGVALLFSCAYFYIAFAYRDRMLPQEITWLVYGYLVAFGIAQCLTAARMIYADRHQVTADR
jgi:uncharacterized membrane protein HdeD (DUF308 family)